MNLPLKQLNTQRPERIPVPEARLWSLQYSLKKQTKAKQWSCCFFSEYIAIRCIPNPYATSVPW